jgi:poly(3-hydroxybutyrate) depolymerase
MYRSLLSSAWFLGGAVCEYRQKRPNNPFYSPRPDDARTGVRNADYTERAPLLAAFRELHPARYQLRLAALATSKASAVSEMRATFQHGQTFVTWKQPAGAANSYRVYRSNRPISTLAPDLLVAEVDGNSSLNLMASINRLELSKVRAPDSYVVPRRVQYVIRDGEPPLETTTGLFVHTAKTTETVFYAVSAGDDTSFISTSVDEQPEPTSAVRQNDTDYTHWTADGLAYTFRVHAPRGNGPYPLIGVLHGALFQYDTPDRERFAKLDGAEGDTAVRVAMDFPLIRGRIRDINPPAYPAPGWQQEKVDRVLWTLDWVAKSFPVDRDRVSLRGESMGALGSLRIALLHPEGFAAIHAYVPPLRPMNAISQSSPIAEIRNAAEELPYILYTAGRTDHVVGWPPQVEFATAAQASRVGFALYWDKRGHIYDAAFPATWDEPDGIVVPPLTSFSRKQSFPAISRLSVDSDPGTVNLAVRPAQRPALDTPGTGDLIGSINGWVDWDRTTIIDTVQRYEITLQLIPAAPSASASADVTPRRLQQFRAKARDHYRYELSSVGKSSVLSSGVVAADERGRITVPAVSISKQGTRLVIWS